MSIPMWVRRKLNRVRWLTRMKYYEKVVESGQLVIAPENFPGRFIVSATSDLAKRVITFGSFEPELTSLLDHFSDIDGDIVNIGANVGFYSVFFARTFPNAHKVIAIEPNPEAFEMLKANIALNGFGGLIEPLQVCVGEGTGQIDLEVKMIRRVKGQPQGTGNVGKSPVQVGTQALIAADAAYHGISTISRERDAIGGWDSVDGSHHGVPACFDYYNIARISAEFFSWPICRVRRCAGKY